MTLRPGDQKILDNLHCEFPRAMGVPDERLLEEYHDFRMSDTDDFLLWLEFCCLIDRVGHEWF